MVKTRRITPTRRNIGRKKVHQVKKSRQKQTNTEELENYRHTTYKEEFISNLLLGKPVKQKRIYATSMEDEWFGHNPYRLVISTPHDPVSISDVDTGEMEYYEQAPSHVIPRYSEYMEYSLSTKDIKLKYIAVDDVNEAAQLYGELPDKVPVALFIKKLRKDPGHYSDVDAFEKFSEKEINQLKDLLKQNQKIGHIADEISRYPKSELFARTMTKNRSIFQDAKTGAVHHTPKSLVLDWMEIRLRQLEDRQDAGKRVNQDEIEELRTRIQKRDFSNTSKSEIELEQLDFTALKESKQDPDMLLSVVEPNAVYCQGVAELGEDYLAKNVPWSYEKEKIVIFRGKYHYSEVDGDIVTPTKVIAELDRKEYYALLSELKKKK